MKYLSWLFFSIWTVIFSLTLAGCAFNPKPESTGSGWFSDPPALVSFSGFLSFILPVALLAFSVGIALYFIVPEGHTLSLTLAAVAGFVEAIALVLKVSLWLVPWVAGATALAAIGFFVYEYIYPAPATATPVTGTSTATASTSVINAIASKL